MEQLWTWLDLQDNYRLLNFSLERPMERPLHDPKEQNQRATKESLKVDTTESQSTVDPIAEALVD